MVPLAHAEAIDERTEFEQVAAAELIAGCYSCLLYTSDAADE